VRNEMWNKAVEFHGHACPGLAIGFRAAEAALDRLSSKRDIDEDILVICETKNCAVDAIQLLTGCTLGKGNLFLRDHGKNVFTFARRADGDAVRVALRFGSMPVEPGIQELRQKVQAGRATPDDRARLREATEKVIQSVLSLPVEDLFTVEEDRIELPAKAEVYETVRCVKCGEGVMLPRAVRTESGFLCPSCANS